MPDDVILQTNPANHCAPSSRWPAAGGVPVRFRRDPAGDVYDGWQVAGQIEGEALRTPGAATAAAMTAEQQAGATEASRRALVLQRLLERADQHATGKTATITTLAQAQTHIRELHRTVEALCRLQRAEILQDL